MRFLKTGIRKLILESNLEALETLLINNKPTANKEIQCGLTSSAHPLHYICDCVFEGKITDQDAVQIAMIFLKHGAHVNGNKLIHLQDSPLVAAASLHADQVALLYIEQGASISHQGCHGGTALHWAAWTGGETVVRRILNENIDIEKRCHDFNSTPLFWAFHGYKKGGERNRRSQYQCCELLLEAGANPNTANAENLNILSLLDQPEDEQYRKLLQPYLL